MMMMKRHNRDLRTGQSPPNSLSQVTLMAADESGSLPNEIQIFLNCARQQYDFAYKHHTPMWALGIIMF